MLPAYADDELQLSPAGYAGAELTLPSEEAFDAEAWAEETVFAAIPRVRVKNLAGEYLYEGDQGPAE